MYRLIFTAEWTIVLQPLVGTQNFHLYCCFVSLEMQMPELDYLKFLFFDIKPVKERDKGAGRLRDSH